MEVSEEKANQRVEEFKRQLKTLTGKLKEAENRAEYAEKSVKKLQKEVDRLEGNVFKFTNLQLIILYGIRHRKDVYLKNFNLIISYFSLTSLLNSSLIFICFI